MQHKKLIPEAQRIHLHPILTNSKKRHDRIAISMQDRIEVIEVIDILYLKSESNYNHIYCKSGLHLMASVTLKKFDNLLCPRTFLRVHNSYIIHTKYLKTYTSGNGVITMANNKQVPVSRSKKTEVIQYLKELMIS